MAQTSCIFCKIIAKEIPSTIIKENQTAMAIRDISPKAPTHYLIMPKMHIESVLHMTDDQQVIVGQVLTLARDIAVEAEITGFNLIANSGVSAGQSVLHMHFHFLAGANIYEHGLRL
jgi:histidine triad (HIT) family protein